MDFGLLYYGILTFSIYVRRKRSELCLLMFVWYPGILKFFMLLHWKFNNIGIINLKLTFRHRLGQALVFILPSGIGLGRHLSLYSLTKPLSFSMCSSKTVVGSSWAALLWNHLRALDTDMATLESLCVCVWECLWVEKFQSYFTWFPYLRGIK